MKDRAHEKTKPIPNVKGWVFAAVLLCAFVLIHKVEALAGSDVPTLCGIGQELENSKYPPAKPGALNT